MKMKMKSLNPFSLPRPLHTQSVNSQFLFAFNKINLKINPLPPSLPCLPACPSRVEGKGGGKGLKLGIMHTGSQQGDGRGAWSG